jgi:hypothetical protein
MKLILEFKEDESTLINDCESEFMRELGQQTYCLCNISNTEFYIVTVEGTGN